MSTIRYKPGQGYWTRMMSAIGGVVLVAASAIEVSNQLSALPADGPITPLVRASIGIAIFVLGSLFVLWLCYAAKGPGEFLIATEGEMRKVNWSTRKEIFGSTRVVILISLMIAVALFVVDLGFANFFRWIDVLETGTSVEVTDDELPEDLRTREGSENTP